MGARQRYQAARAEVAVGGGVEQGYGPKGKKDYNETRRQLYSTDSSYRDKVKEQVRQQYRKDHPKKPTKLLGGLLKEPTQREVFNEFVDPDGKEFFTEDCYTVPEAAAALGKSQLTVKRWIKEKLVPPPILVDSVYGYLQYSEKELKIFAEVLREHEKHYDYLHCTHLSTIDSLWQRIEGHRKML
jgi:hypothetical protein